MRLPSTRAVGLVDLVLRGPAEPRPRKGISASTRERTVRSQGDPPDSTPCRSVRAGPDLISDPNEPTIVRDRHNAPVCRAAGLRSSGGASTPVLGRRRMGVANARARRDHRPSRRSARPIGRAPIVAAPEVAEEAVQLVRNEEREQATREQAKQEDAYHGQVVLEESCGGAAYECDACAGVRPAGRRVAVPCQDASARSRRRLRRRAGPASMLVVGAMATGSSGNSA
jgi:hypothetical protein